MDINGIIHTWGHPMIAINIAQWISSKFYVEISKWIFENKERKGDEKFKCNIRILNYYSLK